MGGAIVNTSDPASGYGASALIVRAQNRMTPSGPSAASSTCCPSGEIENTRVSECWPQTGS